MHSARSIYNIIKNKNIKTYTSLQQLGIMAGSETLRDIAKSMPDLSMALIPITGDVNQSLYPAKYGNLVAYRGNDNRVEFMFYPTTDYISNAKGLVFVNSYHTDRDWLFGWHKICTTSVADVPVTDIVPADTTTFVDFAGNCNYCVKNGVCYVTIWGVKITSTGASKQTGVYLPKSANGRVGAIMAGVGDGMCHAFAYILESGDLFFDVKDANTMLYGSFSYPVLES